MEVGLGAAVVYALEEDCRGRQRDRLFCQVQGGPETPRAETIANAELIVRAVNAHDELVTACERALDEMCESVAADCAWCGGEGGWTEEHEPRPTPVRHRGGCPITAIRAALAKAEGRQ